MIDFILTLISTFLSSMKFSLGAAFNFHIYKGACCAVKDNTLISKAIVCEFSPYEIPCNCCRLPEKAYLIYFESVPVNNSKLTKYGIYIQSSMCTPLTWPSARLG